MALREINVDESITLNLFNIRGIPAMLSELLAKSKLKVRTRRQK